jgi:hypothetical protein
LRREAVARAHAAQPRMHEAIDLATRLETYFEDCCSIRRSISIRF